MSLLIEHPSPLITTVDSLGKPAGSQCSYNQCIRKGMNQPLKAMHQPIMHAIVLGYTGETGRVLVNKLIHDPRFRRIVLIGRRKVNVCDHDALKQPDLSKRLVQHVVDFDHLEAYKEAFLINHAEKASTVVYCMLGTTQSQSGADGLIKVDKDYTLAAAQICKNIASQFHYVSSKGANAHSSFLYAKTKGEVELALSKMGFDDRLVLYRPGLIMVNRKASRLVESCLRWLCRPVDLLFLGWISSRVDEIASSMIQATFMPIHDLIHYENKSSMSSFASRSYLIQSYAIHGLSKSRPPK